MRRSTVMSTKEISRHLGLKRETLRRLSFMRLCTEHPQPRLLKLLVILRSEEPRLFVISVKQSLRMKGLNQKLKGLLRKEHYLGLGVISLRSGRPIRRLTRFYKVQGLSSLNSGLFSSRKTSKVKAFRTDWSHGSTTRCKSKLLWNTEIE